MLFDSTSIISKLQKIDCISFGDFTLKSGEKSNIYFDLRRIISYPQVFREISELLYEKVKELSVNNKIKIVGIPLSGILFSSGITVLSDISSIVVRKEVKEHGLMKEIEGVFKEGDRCILIDDVLTSGKSILEIIPILEKHKLKIEGVVVILNRDKGGVQKLKEKRIEVKSLLTESEVLKFMSINSLISRSSFPDHNQKFIQRLAQLESPRMKELFKIVLEKETNICFAADMKKTEDLLSMIDIVGPYICLVKTHIDIIEDFTVHTTRELRKLSQKHNFMIMEDRKIADIGKIGLNQLSGFYNIKDWADFVTVHTLIGKKSLIEISKEKSIDIVPVLDLSSNLDQGYREKSLDIVKDLPVGGFVTQKGVDNGKYINFMPGISTTAINDDRGQNYKNPRTAIRDGADILIIGRDLYGSGYKNPEERAKYLKELCWKNYLSN